MSNIYAHSLPPIVVLLNRWRQCWHSRILTGAHCWRSQQLVEIRLHLSLYGPPSKINSAPNRWSDKYASYDTICKAKSRIFSITGRLASIPFSSLVSFLYVENCWRLHPSLIHEVMYWPSRRRMVAWHRLILVSDYHHCDNAVVHILGREMSPCATSYSCLQGG